MKTTCRSHSRPATTCLSDGRVWGDTKHRKVQGRTQVSRHHRLELSDIYGKAEAFSVGVVMLDVLGVNEEGDVFDRLCNTHLAEERRAERGSPPARPDDPGYGRRQPGKVYSSDELPETTQLQTVGCPRVAG